MNNSQPMDPVRAGRLIGLMILVQMISGPLVNFVLTEPLFGSTDFLVSAAPHARQIALSVLIGLGMGVLSLGIAIVAFPYVRQHSEHMALWILTLAVVGCVTTFVEQISVMSMLSLSEAFTKAGAANGDLFQVLRGVVAMARKWPHLVNLIVAGSQIALFSATLYRFRFVPRLLAAFDVVAALLQVVAVTLPFFGRDVNFALIAPLGLSQLLLALWLLVKGLQGK